ncbi:MAG: MBL fold metallo-hydrolase [Bacilli bacterium]|nr:MBL fold metallo-hydrolase [Bacilli bacterium]
MKVIKIPVGLLQANCYLVINKDKILIVDPGSEFDKIQSKIKELNVKPIGILITHSHFDHIGALKQFEDLYNIPICNHKNRIEFDDFKFKIIDTEGHTSDSVTFYFYENSFMFTGDFLFKETIGRTDLETSDAEQMKKSIAKIKQLPIDTIIYPGHGENSTLEHELKNNFFLF